MIKLSAIKVLINFWKRASNLSDKLAPRTWKVLATISVFLLCLSAVGLFYSKPKPKTSEVVQDYQPYGPTVGNKTIENPYPGLHLYSSIDPDLIRVTAELMQPSTTNYSKTSCLEAVSKKVGVFDMRLDLNNVIYCQVTVTDSRCTPIAGNWNGDRVDTIGLYKPATATFYLRNSNIPGGTDLTFTYGQEGAGWIPLATYGNTGSLLAGTFTETSASQEPQISEDKKPAPHDTLFGISLFGLIASTMSTISNMTLAWLSNNRQKREFILKQLEEARKAEEMKLKLKQIELDIKQRELEILKLQQEIDRAKGTPLITLA